MKLKFLSSIHRFIDDEGSVFRVEFTAMPKPENGFKNSASIFRNDVFQESFNVRSGINKTTAIRLIGKLFTT